MVVDQVHRYRQVEMAVQVVVAKSEHLEATATHLAHRHHKVTMAVVD